MIIKTEEEIKKEQIEAIAKDICAATQKTNYRCDSMCNTRGYCAYCKVMAEQLYENNLRKQIEGEWKKVYQNNKAAVYECSRCGHLTLGTSDHCICGAKMKGGIK